MNRILGYFWVVTFIQYILKLIHSLKTKQNNNPMVRRFLTFRHDGLFPSVNTGMFGNCLTGNFLVDLSEFSRVLVSYDDYFIAN